MDFLFSRNVDEYKKTKKSQKVENPSKVHVDELGKLLDAEGIAFVIQQVKYSFMRAKAMVPARALSAYVVGLLQKLIAWCENTIGDCVETLVGLSAKIPHNPTISLPYVHGIFALVKTIGESVQGIQDMLDTVVIPMFQYTYYTIQEDYEQFKSDVEEMEEMMDQVLVNLNSWIVDCAIKQLVYKDEFKFKEEQDQTWMSSQATMSCMKFCQYLKQHFEIIDNALKGLNHEVFMSQLGVHLFTEVLGILKRLRVTPFSGGFMLMYDIRNIINTIEGAGFSDAVKDQFEELSMLFKLFCIDKTQLVFVVRWYKLNTYNAARW